MPRRRDFDLVPLDPGINRNLRNLRKSKAKGVRMEDDHSDRCSEGHNDQNELLGMQEPTLRDCWKPMVNENYLEIRKQAIGANHFELKPTLILMVQQ